MRNFVLLLCAFFLSAAAFWLPTAAQAQSASVCFYEHINFQGRSYCIRVGERIDFVGPRVNDQFSSVRIPPGVVVTMCEHANFQGRCRRLSRSESNFVPFGFNDIVSAVEAQWDRGGRDWDDRRDRDRDWDRRRDDDFRHDGGRRGEICFYEHANYQGRRYCAPVGAVVPAVGRAFNDIFSSVQMPRGASVTVCRDDNFRGPCTTFRGDVAFVGGAWNDTISSFRSHW